MNPPEPAKRIIAQGRAIGALDTIQPTGAFEQAVTSLLLAAYKRRLRAIIAVAPAWMGERIVSASEAIREDRRAVWMSEN